MATTEDPTNDHWDQSPMQPERKHLRRLEPGFYQGQAYVHWILTIEDRHIGWLTPVFHSTFRELLTHTMFRYSLVCPIYCLMPDHLHLLWIGINQQSDQQLALRYLRRHTGRILAAVNFSFQHQAYDHVLRDDERQESGLQQLIEYIARNPERKQLVAVDGFASYPFSGSLIPGYPHFMPFADDFWPQFWRCYSNLSKNGFAWHGPAQEGTS